MQLINCCFCDSTTTKDAGYWVRVNVPITWNYPKWGNFVTGINNAGMALCCEKCNNPKTELKDCKHVIEFPEGDNGVIYHPISWTNGIPSLKK